ncbi:PH-domain-containing protein [Dichomitus squalens]|uniref:PH-domain-containing protein n=1 Tax=Dichomitus squalens TaxID=114155 RepID=A0A4Q9Q6Y5_9APHY|nr:PH-domain-containing protein [Dichomitus squalens]TBU62900.1 PH-domain-containing protein [Dichomitus squalens]
MSAARSVPPPSHQEVARKLSVHSKPPLKKPTLQSVPVSGTESDSDSVFTPDVISPSPMSTSLSGALLGAPSSQPPLQSIAERRSHSGGEDSEEDEEDEEGGWRTQDFTGTTQQGSHDETVIKSGYLWKKGERRKTWKKRWFVLRPAHLAFYKTSAEYKLLRLLDLTEVHSCTPVVLKKHQNTFGLVSPTRTFYLQAENPQEVREWVSAINDTRVQLLSTSTRNSVTSPIPIPTTPTTATAAFHYTGISSSPSHSHHLHQLTSSDSDDASPNSKPNSATQPVTLAGESVSPSKPVLSGYLMKCGSRRHNWHKRWFVLSGEKLIYCRSHMDTKPHRQIPLALVIDALEYDLPPNRNHPAVASPGPQSPQHHALSSSPADGERVGTHTFKIVTTKRTLLLCAPSEEEEIKWLSAIRALIARRSGQGVVPGEPSSFPSVSPAGNVHVHAPAAGSSGATSPGSAAPTQKRRDSFVRRLSLSGGGSPSLGGSATAPGVATSPQEAPSERQS